MPGLKSAKTPEGGATPRSVSLLPVPHPRQTKRIPEEERVLETKTGINNV